MTNLLDKHYPLTQAQIDQYQRDGYIKLKDVFGAETLSHYGDIFMELVKKYNKDNTPLEKRDTYGMAFLQISNLWESDDRAKTFAFSKRLARIASELMQVKGVRMYHDQALFKEPSGGFTPWHVDQFYWPLSNSNSVTAWVPLQAVPLNMGPLQFAVGSQTIMEHRNLAISDESERKISKTLKDFPIDDSAFALGEVSFHSGWTFHRAGPNQTKDMRKVMTVIYIEDGVRVATPNSQNQENDRMRWTMGTEIGEPIESDLLIQP
jgi:ectoine hydroxylase-related dioxygenase (phytanoyl-CoA dioxygenase family)